MSASTPRRSLYTQRGHDYNTGVSEADVESKAHEDGQAGVLDPGLVGVNSHPFAVEQMSEGHEAATSVIAHELRGLVGRDPPRQPRVHVVHRLEVRGRPGVDVGVVVLEVQEV